MEHNKYELPFHQRLPTFSSITIWDKPSELKSHIEQLNTRKKLYSVEKRKGLIRIWSETRAGKW